MSDLVKELLGSSDGSNEPKEFVFFNDENPEGYTNTTDFLTSLRKQKQSKKAFRVPNVQKLFDNMSLGRSLLGEPSLTMEDGEEVIWVRFAYGKTRQNIQILNECGLFNFINDYANGRIHNVPTFVELIKSISQK
jgi:hypothetical protein